MTRFFPEWLWEEAARLLWLYCQMEIISQAGSEAGEPRKTWTARFIRFQRCQAKIRLRVEAAALTILIYIGSHPPSSINGHVQYPVCAREAPSPNSTPALWFLTRRWWKLSSRVRERWNTRSIAHVSLQNMCCSSPLLVVKTWPDYKVSQHAFFIWRLCKSGSLCGLWSVFAHE